MSVNEDVKDGDLLTTSGVDGVYPPGLPVAKVVKVDRRSDSSFARIQCQPVARLQGVTHVMVLAPVTPRPAEAAASAPVDAQMAAHAASAAASAAKSAAAPPTNPRRAAQGARR